MDEHTPMKPSKKLMRDFAKVVLPGCAMNKEFGWIAIHKRKGYRLDNLQTVVELAQKWCDAQRAQMALHYFPANIDEKDIEQRWVAAIYYIFKRHDETIRSGYEKNQITAIMKAVVEAGKV